MHAARGTICRIAKKTPRFPQSFHIATPSHAMHACRAGESPLPIDNIIEGRARPWKIFSATVPVCASHKLICARSRRQSSGVQAHASTPTGGRNRRCRLPGFVVRAACGHEHGARGRLRVSASASSGSSKKAMHERAPSPLRRAKTAPAANAAGAGGTGAGPGGDLSDRLPRAVRHRHPDRAVR